MFAGLGVDGHLSFLSSLMGTSHLQTVSPGHTFTRTPGGSGSQTAAAPACTKNWTLPLQWPLLSMGGQGIPLGEQCAAIGRTIEVEGLYGFGGKTM
jgi:hypothetical protein